MADEASPPTIQGDPTPVYQASIQALVTELMRRCHTVVMITGYHGGAVGLDGKAATSYTWTFKEANTGLGLAALKHLESKMLKNYDDTRAFG